MATDTAATGATDAVAAEPSFTRPLDGYRDRFAAISGPHIGLEIIEPKAIVNLRGDPDDQGFVDAAQHTLGLPLPTEPNRCTSADADGHSKAQTLFWLGPDEWLVMVPDGQARPIEAALRAARPDDPWLSIVDLSHNITGLRLSGPHARDMLASGCPLDLHQRSFDVDDCAQTVMAKTRILLRQVSVEPAFEIWVRNSFARYLADWLEDAAGLLEAEALPD